MEGIRTSYQQPSSRSHTNQNTWSAALSPTSVGRNVAVICRIVGGVVSGAVSYTYTCLHYLRGQRGGK